ncbi:MAG: hypothetical protein ACTS9Y_00115 [Methylophilus sp.]|uniref:hypothetical protein n=1 Tax=Methylophilus sp. TaxID=29541 RepID=UPI003F9F7624
MFKENYDVNEATFANFLLEIFGLIIGILGEIMSSIFGGIDTDLIDHEEEQSVFGSMFDGIMDAFDTPSFSNNYSFTNINHHGGEMIGGMIDDSLIH